MKGQAVLKKGEFVIIFLPNNYAYEGEVLDVDEVSVRILDDESKKEKIIPFSSIIDITVKKEVKNDS